jgi:hypothetical protein
MRGFAGKQLNDVRNIYVARVAEAGFTSSLRYLNDRDAPSASLLHARPLQSKTIAHLKTDRFGFRRNVPDPACDRCARPYSC